VLSGGLQVVSAKARALERGELKVILPVVTSIAAAAADASGTHKGSGERLQAAACRSLCFL